MLFYAIRFYSMVVSLRLLNCILCSSILFCSIPFFFQDYQPARAVVATASWLRHWARTLPSKLVVRSVGGWGFESVWKARATIAQQTLQAHDEGRLEGKGNHCTADFASTSFFCFDTLSNSQQMQYKFSCRQVAMSQREPLSCVRDCIPHWHFLQLAPALLFFPGAHRFGFACRVGWGIS